MGIIKSIVNVAAKVLPALIPAAAEAYEELVLPVERDPAKRKRILDAKIERARRRLREEQGR